ncbi:MAG: hypothetical protein AAF349_23545, partial [Cyanobacteria bacterium P01_A01_bin.68]
MQKRINYYKELAADYSRSGLIADDLKKKLIQQGEEITTKKEDTLPEINSSYTLQQIEQENKEWWP